MDNRIINVPLIIQRVYKRNQNLTISLKEISLRAASRLQYTINLPKSLENILRNQTGVCECSSRIFIEAYLILFYLWVINFFNFNSLLFSIQLVFFCRKNHGSFGVPFSQICCSKMCCDNFLMKNSSNIELIFWNKKFVKIAFQLF